MKSLIINIMCITFPVLLYFMAIAYNKTIDNRNNKLLMELSLLLSLYFIISYGDSLYTYYPFYLFNIPILIGYLKKRNSVCILMSIIVILYSYNYYNLNAYLLIVHYILCFLLYKIDKKYFIYNYTILNSVFMYLYINDYYYILLLVYTITVYVTIIIVKYVDTCMGFYMSLKEIENSKQLQQSLFKISHEVKNPIAVCKGYLELMDGSKEKYDLYVPIINNEINHSLSILKDFSSIGKLKVDMELMDIGLLIEDIIDSFKLMFQEHHIDISYQNNYDELYVMGDYIRLKEVFINMIKNAIEAITKEGIIKINITKKDSFILIRIIDNGVGISEENLAKIMTPFFTTKNDGTGLGTYLSKEIIDNHNGTIHYSSDSGGTEVLIKLREVKL